MNREYSILISIWRVVRWTAQSLARVLRPFLLVAGLLIDLLQRIFDYSLGRFI